MTHRCPDAKPDSTDVSLRALLELTLERAMDVLTTAIFAVGFSSWRRNFPQIHSSTAALEYWESWASPWSLVGPCGGRLRAVVKKLRTILP